jgi:prepilin-type N-terminal cleavage/methylation domain-containing protein
MSKNRLHGFTLAELLIALAILGEIATFTIPKILSSQQNSKYKALAKEVAASIASSYHLYKTENSASSSNRGMDFLDNYLNYVHRETSSGVSIDTVPTASSTTLTCGSSNPCYKLQNGGLLRPSSCPFGGTTELNAVYVIFDPDGIVTSAKDSVEFILYYSGRLSSRATLTDGTLGGSGCATPRSPDPTADPSWFSW